MFRTHCDINTRFGIITSVMTLALLWNSGFLDRRSGFPSWSWMGWIGRVVTGANMVQAPEWNGKYTWIHWYLFDSTSAAYRLLPQRTSDDEIPPGSLQYSHLFSKLSSKVYNELPSQIGNLDMNPNGDRSASSLQSTSKDSLTSYYVKRIDTPATKLASFFSHSLPSNFCLDNTLLFETFTRRVLMSVYDPWGRRKQDSTHVHLYDESPQYIGVAWLNDLTMWAQAGAFAVNDGQPSPISCNYPIDIALLSGPETATTATKQTYVWPQATRNQEVPLHRSATFYRVLLLSKFSSESHQPLSRCFERVGLGEIRADRVEAWNTLNWEEVVLF